MVSFARAVLIAVACLVMAFAARVGAQQNPQEHPGQYSQADVEAGSRLYSAQCQLCHGLTGDQVRMSQRGPHFLLWDDADWLVAEVKGFLPHGR